MLYLIILTMISQCGSHVGNVIQSIWQNITFDRHVRGIKLTLRRVNFQYF
jgi:hypothetical protein